MRYGVIAVAVISILLGSTARDSYGDIAYGVGKFMDFDAFSGIGSLDTDTGTAKMLVHTPGLRWYGATDGPTTDTFYAVANPWYDPNPYTDYDPNYPDRVLRLPPRSDLFLINTTTWTVNFVGHVTARWPITEIALDNGSGILYGTDYNSLYKIPTTGGDVTVIEVGSFSPVGTPVADMVDYVYSLDYDPIAGLVGTSRRPGPDETDLYHFNNTTGLGTLFRSDIPSCTDVWYSPGSGTLFGVNRRPGQMLQFDATGEATVIGTIRDEVFHGVANATPGPGSTEPSPFVTIPAPLTNLGYETLAYADVETLVDIPGVGTDYASPPVYENYGSQAAANVIFDVPAAVPGSTPSQNTNGSVTIDLSSANGMLRVSSVMTAAANGSNEGVPDATRHSSAFGNANILGYIGVGTPAGGTDGMPMLFGASVYIDGWINGMHVFFGPGVYPENAMLPTWNLTITDHDDPGIVYLDNVDQTSNPWAFTFGVRAGQILDYEFNIDGELFEAIDGDYYLYADLDFGAAVPEPATMLLLCSGVIPLVLKKRRRRS